MILRQLFVYVAVFYCSVYVEIEALNGRYTRSIESFKLTVPHKRSPSGDFQTFSIPHFFESKTEWGPRKKRSLEDPETLHYGIHIDGEMHHVELWPNRDFVSPNLVFEARDPKAKIQDRKIRTLGGKKLCHYTGRVRGVENSRAALSTCEGLAGYIVINNKRFFIEPVEDHEPNSEGHHLHVVYQRHSDEDKFPQRRCGTTGSWEEAWKNRLKNEILMSDEHATLNIEKRGYESLHRYLETLVVCDKKFLRHHKKRDVETYVLTVMNMVADFYHDASSGNQMDVVVVRIIYLEKEEEEIDLVINRDADKSLKSFCDWQMKINPKEENNPNHHDIAVLLTRYDICADNMADCGLMGLAYMATACTKDEPCAINEDGGLVLAIVVAHEMGHVMGCAHDKEGESSCPATDTDESYFVMAPYVHLYTTRWSTCSRGFITALFENNLGECLNDEPQSSLYKMKNALPGTVYDANAQCEFAYPGSKVCTMKRDNFCEMLVCATSPKECLSNQEPPADGTKCGENKWCYRKQCIEIGERPEAVNGGWGSWGSWTSCSRTCGGGVQISERDCNNPPPSNKGRYCVGERKKVKICNTNPCPDGSSSFREQQCADHNNKPFQDEIHTWKPMKMDDEPCVLYCTNEQNSFAKLEPRVKDGTPCKAGTKNMCISGSCRKVGCDNQLDSDAVEDICGVCNGDGTQCKIIEETYRDVGATDYKKVVTIPAGVRNILIEEQGPSVNTIAISDSSEKKFYLNGEHREEADGAYKFGGVEGVYSHPEQGKESLVIKGPTKEDLIFFVCFYKHENVGYKYKYSEPSTDTSYVPHYQWELLEWTECTAKCGGGTQTASYQCVEDKSGKVSSNFCSGEEKPEGSTKACNQDPCKTKWKIGKWSKCHACKNKSGVRFRGVECVQENPKAGADDILMEDDKCEGPKPGTKELCNAPKKCKGKRTSDDIPEEYLEDVYNQISGLESRRDLGSNTTDACIPKIGNGTMQNENKNKTKELPKIKLKPGGIIKDRVPPEEIKIIRVPVKPSKLTTNISDTVFEEMGDVIGDTLDTGHAQIVTGKKAAEILKKMGEKAEEKRKNEEKKGLDKSIQ